MNTTAKTQIASTLLKEARVLIVRHAQSLFNRDWPPAVNSYHPTEGFQKYGPQHYEFASHPAYVDCHLSDEGIKQCQEQSQVLHQMRDISTVIISPMRRTLQTAHFLFQQHPDFTRIKFLIHPDLRENLKCSCDLPLNDFKHVAHQFKDCFPNLDTQTYMTHSGVQEAKAERGKHWFINNLQDEFKEDILKRLQQDPGFNLQEHFLNTIKQQFPVPIETPFNIYQRQLKVKEFVRQQLVEQSKGKIVLVGHKTIFKYLTATKWPYHKGKLETGKIGFNFHEEPTEHQTLNNCEIYPLDSHL